MEDFELPERADHADRRAAAVLLPVGVRDAIAEASKIELHEQLRLPNQTLHALESLRRKMASIVAPSIERWQFQLPKVDFGAVEALTRLGATMKQAWERAMPDNWADLQSDEVFATVERVRETGFTLVWVPRAEIIRAVLAVDVVATPEVLIAYRAEILSDAEDCLTHVAQPELQLMRTGVEKAVFALQAGHDWAAQALAACVFTSEAHTFFEHDGLRKIRREMADEDPQDAGLNELRLRTIYLAGARALNSFDPNAADGGAVDFNRHNSVHRITDGQWNELNALAAIMLATAFLREIEHWYPALMRDAPNASQ